MQRFFIVTVLIVSVLATAVPAARADHGAAVDGAWVAHDGDGSAMTLDVAEAGDGSGHFTVVLHDAFATGGICDPAGPVTVVSTAASFDPDTEALYVDFDETTCHAGTPASGGPIHIEFTVVEDDLLLHDSFGVLWRQIGAACPAGEVPDGGFADVPRDGTHAGSIDCLAWWGIASGVAPGRYGPTGDVSRGQMARFVANLLEQAGIDLPSGSDHFSDDDGTPHEDAINGLASLGIVGGLSADRYAPWAPVSRAQMAKFVVAAHDTIAGTALPVGSDRFDDDEGSVLETSIDTAAAAGLVSGTSVTSYSPADAVSRAQMATSLVNLLDRLVTKGLLSLPGG